MKLPNRYKAKAVNSGEEYTGYYFQFPETTYCFDTDPEPRIIHALVVLCPGDWGLPNHVGFVKIDPDTLEEIEK